MAIRSATARIHPLSRSAALEASSLRISRCFSDGKGKVLSEEERAAENIYIQKMERERAEKMKLKTEKEKAQLEKEKGEKVFSDRPFCEIVINGRMCELYSSYNRLKHALPCDPNYIDQSSYILLMGFYNRRGKTFYRIPCHQ